MAPVPMLDLTTLVERPFVSIDGVPYALRTSRDLTLEHYRTIHPIAARLMVLTRAAALTAKDDAELAHIFATVAGIALIAPETVIAALTVLQQAQVAEVFITLSTPSLRTARAILGAHLVGMPPTATVPPPGPTSSHDSRGSSGARRTRGAVKRH